MGVPEIDLERSSFDQLRQRGRSYAFKGSYVDGQTVLAKCDKDTQPAVVTKVGRHNSWVAKKNE